MFSDAQNGSEVPVYLEDQQKVFENPRDLINLKIQGV